MKKLENGYYSYGVYGYANDKMRCTNEFSSWMYLSFEYNIAMIWLQYCNKKYSISFWRNFGLLLQLFDYKLCYY